MEYNVYAPGESMSPYIRCYWTLEGAAPADGPKRERIFPDGCMELLFHYGDLFKKFDGDHFFMQPKSFLHGQLKRFMEVEATGGVGVFSVRFNPAGLRPFVNMDIHKLTDRVVPVHELWGNDAQVWEARMSAAGSAEERIRCVEEFLLSRQDASVDKNNLVAQSVTRIEQAAGMLSIDGLAEELCVVRRHLERKFSEHVGLTPKMFARIMRFNHTLKLIEQKEWSSLAYIAQEGGFYDQAHFIKDFRDFTGLNPTTYFAEDLDLVRFFNLTI